MFSTEEELYVSVGLCLLAEQLMNVNRRAIFESFESSSSDENDEEDSDENETEGGDVGEEEPEMSDRNAFPSKVGHDGGVSEDEEDGTGVMTSQLRFFVIQVCVNHLPLPGTD